MSDNLDPIELEFLMNSPELIKEFERVMATVKDYDASIEASKKGFADYVADQMKSIKVLDENARLTEKQATALKRHSEALEFLKGKIAETFDPTQLGVYNYQLTQTEEAISKIVDSANKNVQLMNPAEIEAANQKLDEALTLLDKISDSTINTNFASADDLETLSQKINETEDGFQQLGTVIDFVQAKMSGMDSSSEEFRQLQADIDTANELLGRTPQLYDATGNSINQMTDALKYFQEQLSDETDPEHVKILNQNIETLEKGIQQLKNTGKSGFDEFGDKLDEQAQKSVTLQTELQNLVNEMAKLRLANKENSEEYEELKTKAIETRTAIAEVNTEVSEGAKNEGNLQGLINVTKEIAAGYGLVTAAVGFFNDNEEESQIIIQKVTAVTAFLQSLQEIQVALNTEDAATTLFLTNVKNIYAAATLRLAAAFGITQLAAQALMATLTLGLSLVIFALIIAFDSLAEKQKEQQELNRKTAESLAEPLMAYRKLREEWNQLGNDLEAKEKFIRDNASEFNKLGVEVKNVTDAENVMVKNTAAVETAMMQRAKAAAAMQLATEQYKKALEAQMEAESDQDTLKNGSFWERGAVGMKVNSRFTVIGDQIDEANKKADEFFKKSLQYEKEAGKTLNKAGLKESTSNSSKFEYSKEIQAEEKKLEIAKARYGKADEMERALYEKKIAYAKKDKEEFQKVTQEKAVFEARILKNSDDEAKKLSDKQQREAEAAAKRAQRLAEQFAESRLKLLEKIAAAEENLKNKESEGDGIAAIKKKYDAIRAEANKLKISSPDMMRIDIAEKKETSNFQYEDQTKNMVKNLNNQKDIFLAFEALKTRIGGEELTKQYQNQLDGFKTFSEKIQSEIDKILSAPGGDLSFVENERLKKLQAMKNEEDKRSQEVDNNKFLKAYDEAVTYQEKLKVIDREYLETKTQLEKISDSELSKQKIALLDKQTRAKKDALTKENRDSLTLWNKLSTDLVGITKRELKIRIDAIKEYYELSKENLTQEQQAFIKNELAKAQALVGNSNLRIYEQSLLQKKKEILEKIADRQGKNNDLVAAEQNQLDEINQQIANLPIQRLQKMSEHFAQAGQILNALGDALQDADSEMAQLIQTAAELANDTANVIGAFTKGIVNGIVALVAAAIKWIGKLFSMGKRARESEQQAAEEMKKRQDEILQAQLEYNAMLRQRMIDETSINDLYKSRVDNIKEEIAARAKAMQQNLKDQQMLFNKLLNMTTVVGQTTEKYGGFLGMGKKTRINEITQSISSLLGLNGNSPFKSIFDNMPKWMQQTFGGANGAFANFINPDTVMITDEMFDKLEAINAQHPLSGDAKTAYEQLKKLRDEYGSFEAANKQLEIQLKNAITGTTAQTLADSIREGLKSGKKSFADFANDIEGFLRDAILAGISAKMIEPKIQELQDALAEMMGDGILSAEERAQFQAMYMAIVNSSQDYMDIINQAGVNVSGSSASVNSLQGAIKGMSQESADIISGQFGGMRIAQLETNQILKAGAAQQLQQNSQMIALQMDIEQNTRRTAENTQKIQEVNTDGFTKVVDGQDKYYKALQAAGIIK